MHHSCLSLLRFRALFPDHPVRYPLFSVLGCLLLAPCSILSFHAPCSHPSIWLFYTHWLLFFLIRNDYYFSFSCFETGPLATMAHQIISYARTFPLPGHPNDLLRWVQGVSSFFFSFFFAQNTKKWVTEGFYLAYFFECFFLFNFFSRLSVHKRQYRACPMSLAHYYQHPTRKNKKQRHVHFNFFPWSHNQPNMSPKHIEVPFSFPYTVFLPTPIFFRSFFSVFVCFAYFPHVGSTKVDRHERQIGESWKEKKYVPTNTCPKTTNTSSVWVGIGFLVLVCFSPLRHWVPLEQTSNVHACPPPLLFPFVRRLVDILRQHDTVPFRFLLSCFLTSSSCSLFFLKTSVFATLSPLPPFAIPFPPFLSWTKKKKYFRQVHSHPLEYSILFSSWPYPGAGKKNNAGMILMHERNYHEWHSPIPCLSIANRFAILPPRYLLY